MSNRIRTLREHRGLSLRAMADDIGMPHSTIDKLEKGDTLLVHKDARKIADFFGVPLSGLLLDRDVETRLSDDEDYLLAIYRGLNSQGRVRFLNVAEALSRAVTAEEADPPFTRDAIPARRERQAG